MRSTGAPATVLFLVFTKGQGEDIGTVQNGHLGWHYVNNIDTCVYFDAGNYYEIGSNSLQWDGLDSEEVMVPAGEYTYYLWGYDSNSVKQKACQWFGGGQGDAGFIQQYDQDNIPLDKPVYYPPPATVSQLSADDGGYAGDSEPGLARRARWTLGSDASDESFIETTQYMGWGSFGKIALMPGDHTKFYVMDAVQSTDLSYVRKLEWGTQRRIHYRH